MDIDIDLDPDVEISDLFKDRITFASLVENGELKKHLVGAYFQTIPKDNVTGFAAIPYKESEKIGYTKIDFLHLTILNNFNSKEEIKKLLKEEPDWSMLENEEIVKQLFHISKHFDVVYQVRPKSIIELADILAIIRPGKMKLLDKYLKDRETVRKELYTKVQKSDLRKSHAVPYAMVIVLNMHVLKGKLYYEAT